MSLEPQIAIDQARLRRDALIRQVIDTLRATVRLQFNMPPGSTLQVVTMTDVEADLRVEFTDASARVIAPLVEAVEILEAIISASDGCVGHRQCAHSMEPWQRARALLQGKWDAYERCEAWPSA